MGKHYEEVAASPMHHTQYAFYLASLFSVACISYDSAQGIIQRYPINKKWFYLYAVMCMFAYAYVRPLIRKKLGSVTQRSINWSTVYAVWLCAAVFYHLPSFDSLGLDVKADVSMLITVFLGSLVILGSLSVAYGTAAAFHLISPRLIDRSSGARDAFTTVVLNSVNLAMACSSYYSLCGNAPSSSGDGGSSTMSEDAVRSAVCGRWLHPLPAVEHSLFSAWVIYGESSVNRSVPNGTVSPGGGAAAAAAAAANTISPVFTTWLTLFAMLLVHSVAEYAAGAALSSAYTSEVRRDLASAKRRAAAYRRLQRRRSAEFASTDQLRQNSSDSYASLNLLSRSTSKAGSLDVLLKTVSSVGSFWNFPSSPSLESMGRRAASFLLFRDDCGIDLTTGASPAIFGVNEATPVPENPLPQMPNAASGVGVVVPSDSPSPSFLPMFPWYSGTSADLLKTLFDLMVSVKLFLGRFDQRTMQAATANTGGGGGTAAAGGVPPPPHAGDGFTFEHLADQEEAWVDFVADTGDGGDSTYSVARCLAAPKISVDIPTEMITAATGAPPPTTTNTTTTRVLPRATCLVHGGDLAYPSPTDQTYEQRLFRPYEDALPPPSYIHPGNLVVNKPDLPTEYWQEADNRIAAGKEKKGRSGGGEKSGEKSAAVCGCGGGDDATCHSCRKSAVLGAYDGPSAFLIPGNHDWIDGLETFTRHIIHKGWMGGWLLPQEKSYFSLRLPGGWWLFALDLALVEDLDMSQYRYFARIAEERMGPGDAAIIVSHAPYWLINWFWGRHEGKNLRQLLRGPLRGRARVHLCGDLHFYMRHSFQPYKKEGSAGGGGGVSGGLGGISPPASELSTPAGGSPVLGGSPMSSRCPTPPLTMAPEPFFSSSSSTSSQHHSGGGGGGGQLHQSLLNKLKAVRQSTTTNTTTPPFGSSPPPMASIPGSAAAASSSPPLLSSSGDGKVSSLKLPSSSTTTTRTGWGDETTTTTGIVTDSAYGGEGDGRGNNSQFLQHNTTNCNSNIDFTSNSSGESASGGFSVDTLGSSPPLLNESPHMADISSPFALVGGAVGAADASTATTAPMQIKKIIPGGSESTTTTTTTPDGGGGGVRVPSLPPLPPSHHLYGSSPLHGSSPPTSTTTTTTKSTTAATNLQASPPLGTGTPFSGSSPTTATAVNPQTWWPSSLRVRTPREGSSPVAAGVGFSLSEEKDKHHHQNHSNAASQLRRNTYSASGLSVEGEWEAPPPGWLLNDPEHLVVCGSGGAFLHPTHVFSYARFRPPHDPAAGPIYLRPPPPPPSHRDSYLSTLKESGGGGGAFKEQQQQFSLRRSHPSDSSLYSLPRSTTAAAVQSGPAGGEYRCQAAFPSPQQSLTLGRSNLHTFRHVNSRFDLIGGMLYYFLVLSVLPRCSGVGAMLDATSVMEVLRLFYATAWSTVEEIFAESYLSLAAVMFLFLIDFGFARSGGVGAISGITPAARRRPEYRGFALAVRARLGGLPAQLAYAAAHTAAHLSAAITLLLLLELGIETVMRYEGVGQDGYHSLYNWYRKFEAQHFPDPQGVRSTLSTLTLGLYPNVIKWAFALFDVPEAIAVSRTAVCAAGGSFAALTRLQTLGYYSGVLLYFWVLATPTVGLIFGLYLYVSGNWLHVHYDESFSALQVAHHKGYLKLHVTRSGDLEIFALGLEESPSNWREDPRWRGVGGGGAVGVAGHRARYPSRWTPVTERGSGVGGRKKVVRTSVPPEAQLKVVDYLYVPKQATRT